MPTSVFLFFKKDYPTANEKPPFIKIIIKILREEQIEENDLERRSGYN
jgi:hypothetical protein